MPKAIPMPKVQLTIRIDKDVLERTEMHALASREKKSAVMQKALIAYLDNINAPWPPEPDYDGED